MLVIPGKLIAVDTVPVNAVPIVYTKDELVQKVYQYAKISGVKSQTMINVIDCEDTTWTANQQSNIVRGKEREESYGLAQINLPSHPDISYDQAVDPDFAISYMADQLSKGKGNQWSCYRKLY